MMFRRGCWIELRESRVRGREVYIICVVTHAEWDLTGRLNLSCH
jgi:hypothetical protein